MSDIPMLTHRRSETTVTRVYDLSHPVVVPGPGPASQVRVDKLKVTYEIFHDGPVLSRMSMYGQPLTAKGAVDQRTDAAWHPVYRSNPLVDALADRLENNDEGT